MIVLSELNRTYDDDPARDFHFSDFAKRTSDVLFFAGHFDYSVLPYIFGKPIWCLDLEEPNKFFSEAMLGEFDRAQDRIEKIFSICPYTCDWLNQREASDRRTPVFFPFAARHIPKAQAKVFDVIYTGHAWPSVREFIEPMLRHRHCLVSRRVGSDLDRFITHDRASYREKLELIARSRVAVVHNLLFPTREHVAVVKRIPDACKNVAFKQIFLDRQDESPVVPQLKSRLFEAALCRALILCAEDDWNLVERYFQADREFVYFRRGHLPETLDRILADFGRYEGIIENAFERAAAQYTTKAFAEQYLTAPGGVFAGTRAAVQTTRRSASRSLKRLFRA